MKVKEMERFEGLVVREGRFFKQKLCGARTSRAVGGKMEVGLKREEEKGGLGGAVGWLESDIQGPNCPLQSSSLSD